MEETKKKSLKIVRIIAYIVLILVIAAILFFGTRKSETVNSFNDDGLMFDLSSLNNDSFTNNYYYKQLDESEQKIYKVFYYYSINFEDSFYIMYDHDSDKFARTKEAFSLDFPEYYWWDECTIEQNTERNLFDTYTYYLITSNVSTKEEIIRDYQLVSRKAKEVSEKCSDISDYYYTYNSDNLSYEEFYNRYFDELYLVNIHNWIINNTTYNDDSDNNQDIRSVFLDGESVCAGYSEVFKYLANLENIECISVVGDATSIDEDGKESTEGHEWNVVLSNNNYLNVDVTWDDNDDEDVNYAYFLINDDNFNLSHQISDEFKGIECTSDNVSLLLCGRVFTNDNDGVIGYCKEKTIEEIRNGNTNIYYYVSNDEDYNTLKNWIENNGFVSCYEALHSYYDLNYSIVYDNSSRIIYLSFVDSL